MDEMEKAKSQGYWVYNVAKKRYEGWLKKQRIISKRRKERIQQNENG